MEVTDVRMTLVDADPKGRVLAYCSVTFDGCLVVAPED